MQEIALFAEDGRAVCERCDLADGVLARLRGLLGRDDLPDDGGMLLRPCSSVHTFFMRFPIDVVFLDRGLRVLEVVSHLQPWRVAFRRRASAVLELPPGTAGRRGIRAGERLAWGSAFDGAE